MSSVTDHFITLPDSDTSHLFALHRDLSTFVQTKTKGMAPNFNKRTQLKNTWPEVFRAAIFLSFNFSFFVWLVQRKPSHGYNKLGQFLLRLLEFVATQHLYLALFLFFNTIATDKPL